MTTHSCNHPDWNTVSTWIQNNDTTHVVEQSIIDEFHTITPPQWMTGQHAHAACIEILAKDAPQSIQTLDLRNLPFPILPNCFHRFTQLQNLYLDNNQLTELPPSICNIQKLTVLSLGRNNLTELPKFLKNRKYTLKKLFLGHNNISSLPFCEEEMIFLNHGSIGNNPISEPIGVRWMLKKYATQAAQRIIGLLQSTGTQQQTLMFIEQGINLLQILDEPMIWEYIFHNILNKLLL